MPTGSFPMLVRRLGLLLSILVALAGCGGGGGGSSDPALTYITDWSNRDGGGVTGLSQRIQLYDLEGRLLAGATMNQDAPATQALVFDELGSTPITVRVFVELFSLRDLGGVKTGEVEKIVELDGNRSFRTAVGLEPTLIRIWPPSATFFVQQSARYYATPYADAVDAAFVAPGTIVWSALGGHVSINAQGIALGLSPGSGSVRASHTPTGVQNGALYTVQAFTPTTSKWTVLVFMNAANDLYTFSTLNMNQMERVAQNPDVRFVVQWKQAVIPLISPNPSFVGTRRYLVRPDTTNGIASQLLQDMGQGVDMGSAQTLNDFIEWGQTYYPADRYVLIVWNHGNGWRQRPLDERWTTRAVSYDDETGNSIQIWDLETAFGDRQVDILAWDASLMQMMEVAYEVRDYCDYVVGSEESPPGAGYPYDRVFDNFRDNPDASTSLLAKAFVDGMLEEPSYATSKITQSVLASAQLGALASAIDALGNQLIAHRDDLTSLVPTVRQQAQSYSPTGTRVYRDLIDVCLRLEAGTSIQAVDDASTAVRAAAVGAIVWEGHNANSPGSRGIAIDFSAASTFQSSSKSYGRLRFAEDTSWNEWLQLAP